MNKSLDPAALAQAIGKNRGPAPVHLWNPPFCGEIDMRVARDGTWYYQGSPVSRPAMVRLFSSVLRLDDDGHYYLVTPVEKVRIQVEDCPFVAQLLEVDGSDRNQTLTFITNTQDRIVAGPDNPLTVDEGEEPHPRLLCRSNLYALVARNVFYELAEIAVPDTRDESTVGVWSQNVFFSLGSPS